MYLYCQVVLCLFHTKVKTKQFLKKLMLTHCVLILISAKCQNDYLYLDLYFTILYFTILSFTILYYPLKQDLFFILFLSRGTAFYWKLKTGLSILSIYYIVKKF